MDTNPEYIQVGIIAARDPKTGEFLPAVPIYEERTPELESAEAAAIADISKLFASKMRQYVKDSKLISPSERMEN